jgi:signal transduction histidine kinase
MRQHWVLECRRARPSPDDARSLPFAFAQFAEEDLRVATHQDLAQVFEELERLTSGTETLNASDLVRYLSVLSHELLNPLGVMIGFSDLLLDGTKGPLNEAQEHLVCKIRESGLAQVRLLKRLRGLKGLSPSGRVG